MLDPADHISNQGLFLEAVAISLGHPVTGQLLNIEVPEPKRFGTLRDQQASGWNKEQRTLAWQQAAAASGAESL